MLYIMTVETREALGIKIRELRKANNLSQQKLALMVNVERSYLAKLERGKRNPSIDCIEKIASGLGVTLSELFDGLDRSETAERTTRAANNTTTKTISYSAVRLPPP